MKYKKEDVKDSYIACYQIFSTLSSSFASVIFVFDLLEFRFIIIRTLVEILKNTLLTTTIF